MMITALTALATCLAGGLGAGLRFALDGAVRARRPGPMPWGTVIINVSGSFLLGAITGLVATDLLASGWQLVLGTGLMGGYTTFSTASFETVRLAQQRRLGLAVLHGAGMLLAAVAAAAAGWALGTSLGSR